MSAKKRTSKTDEITRLKAEVVELRELNLNLGKALKMVEDGQWVVISLIDLRRYQNGISRLIEAGDKMEKNYFDLYWTINAESTSRHEPASITDWQKAKESDRF